jgi:anthranilate/para-aminobenzoate synthase component I
MIRKDGTVEYHAGGGIVADSDAAHEWEEIRTKTAFFEGVLREAEEICRYDDADHH